MFTDIVIVLFLLVFAILAFFIIQTLLKLQTTLQNTNRIMAELGFKMEKVDPLLNSLSNAGEILENKTEKWKQHYFAAQQLTSRNSDFYDWTLLTVSLLKNYLKEGKNG
jgi:predicted PurR-regulated permease PerM